MAKVVLPGHFMGRSSEFTDNQSMSNVRLRMGEVQAIYYPTDVKSVSKKFIEYDVWVQHRANGTAVTKTYTHVIAIDALASFPDFSFSTYRADPTASANTPNKKFGPGFGAKVLLLCINGETNNGVILGGIRDFHSDPDDVMDGHHQHSRFNGIDIAVNKDGEWKITYLGATNLDGTLADGVDQDALGTFITISKDGNITLSDVESKNSIVIDHAADKISITSDNEVDVSADTVKVSGDSEVDIDSDTVKVTGQSQVGVNAPQVALGLAEGAAEPVTKFASLAAALSTLTAGLAAYAVAIAPLADVTGTATPALITAIAAFEAALAAAAALNVTAT